MKKNPLRLLGVIVMLNSLVACECEEPTPEVIANFQYQKDESDYKKVAFKNLSINYKSISWDFGDGSALSSEENPVHTFPAEGTFAVKLTATGKHGETSEKTENIVIKIPVSEVIALFQYQTDANDYKKIVFKNMSVNDVSVSWNFGDGSALSSEENPVHTFPAEGTFIVRLTATGKDGNTSEDKEMIVIASTVKTVALQPNGTFGKDALLHGLYSEVDKNYGNNPQLAGNAWTFGGTPGVVRGVIDFDLSQVPSNAIITQAFLSLYAWDSDVASFGRHSTLSGSNACFLQRVTSSWDESTVTWNTQPIPAPRLTRLH